MKIDVYAPLPPNPEAAIASRKAKATECLQTGAGTDLPGTVDGWIAHLDYFRQLSDSNNFAVADLKGAALGEVLYRLGPTLQFGYQLAMAGAGVALEHQQHVVSASKNAKPEVDRLAALRSAVAAAQRSHFAFAAPPPRPASIH